MSFIVQVVIISIIAIQQQRFVCATSLFSWARVVGSKTRLDWLNVSILASIDTEIKSPVEHFRRDFTPVDFSIKDIFLCFDLSDNGTIVTTRSNVTKNICSIESPDFVLDGEELDLVYVKINGEIVPADHYKVNESTLSLYGSYISMLSNFQLETQVRLNPEKNVALAGLYKSGSVLCTHCEPMVS